MPQSPGHLFYEQLNRLLAEAGFDREVEDLCRPSYAQKMGRPSIAPGIYLRMLLVGYFEDLSSQRGIAWRCADSLSLRKFLGMAANEESPHHSSLSVIRERLPHEVHVAVFQWVLTLAREKQVLNGQTLGVDSTPLNRTPPCTPTSPVNQCRHSSPGCERLHSELLRLSSHLNHCERAL